MKNGTIIQLTPINGKLMWREVCPSCSNVAEILCSHEWHNQNPWIGEPIADATNGAFKEPLNNNRMIRVFTISAIGENSLKIRQIKIDNRNLIKRGFERIVFAPNDIRYYSREVQQKCAEGYVL